MLSDGTARCWGSNVSGQLGDGTTTESHTPVAVSGLADAVAIATGHHHTCALLGDGTARCWGWNGHGQLGDSTTTDRYTPAVVALDVDEDGAPDNVDNCRFVPNPGQENADGAIGNGPGIPGNDTTVPVDHGGDACETGDIDNDGIPDGSDTDPGGDITYDDNNNGIMCPTDAADDGPSWDHNCNGKRDGVEGSCPLATNPRGDDDGDGLKNTWEVCKWGTSATVIDSDGDTLGDCTEAADVDGNGVVSFVGDTIYYAKAALLAPSAFGQDGDFDINGDNTLNFTGDVIQEAQFALTDGLCK